MWQQPVSIIAYLLVAVLVVFLSIFLSTFVDLLDKKTNVSGAFLGSILLAATTSLPELFTSLTASLLVNNNALVYGDILGSNLFNMMLFAIIYLFFFKKLAESKFNRKQHMLTILFIGLMYVGTYIASFVFDFNHILWGWFNPMSIFIVAAYALYVIKTPTEEEKEDEEETNSRFDKLTVKQIIILFIIFALGLIGASIGMTYLADWVVHVFGMNATFGGALFLGVATSLPEMTATITLCKKKNFNAAYGNILGSCCFNFIILTLADLLSFKCPYTLYYLDQNAFLLMVLGTVSLLSVLFSLIVSNSKKFKDSFPNRFAIYAVGFIVLGSYIVYLVLSNIDLGLAFAPFVRG